MSKRLAIIGSSGGNLYSQGGNAPVSLLNEILTQATSAGIEVADVIFVAASGSMDNISDASEARIYTFDGESFIPGDRKPLGDLNADVQELDRKLAERIRDGEIDGLISMSSDPASNNDASVEAAVEKGIPVAGSGGTSMGQISTRRGNVISASGTTGTTNRTRAVAFISAFAKEFDLDYRPIIGATGAGTVEDSSPWKRINFRGIMMAAMPAFIAMALLLAIGRIPGLDDWIIDLTGNESASFSAMSSTIINLLPVIMAAIAAKQISGLDEIGIVAGIVAGALSMGGGVIGGIVTGILAGVLVYYIASWLFRNKVPGTTVNILAGSLAGILAGLVGMFIISPAALWIGDGIRMLIDSALGISAPLAGLIAGLLIYPAIMGGVYHAAILPIVLLEMEATGFSFLGAIDMVALVMVSGGITLANIVFPRNSGDRTAAIPGFLINVGFGTFVEAAYPYMFADRKVMFGGILAGGLGGLLVGILGVMGTAYVPSVVAPFLANEGHIWQFALSMIVALLLAFAFTSVANLQARKGKLSNV